MPSALPSHAVRALLALAVAALRTLSRQRRRWQRGLGEAVWRHRSLIGRPRYGVFGMFALPYFLVMELLGPVLELTALVLLPLSFAFGMLDAQLLAAFLAMSLGLGVALSVASLALEC
jgi:cellulose synthase/poly-beta-1,6-N-acetylglucosamine synthase-like glycosyltransferase